jgi:hypothetical protein
MKTMKVALLASAAIAAVSVSARADEVTALKAELQALNARVAQLEAAPAVPTGYSLLTITDGTSSQVPGLTNLSETNKDRVGYGDRATVIGIMPTADMPASTTIEWSGYVRAAIVNYSYSGGSLNSTTTESFSGPVVFFNTHTNENSSNNTSVLTRGQLKVVGKTDTAVGEVGVRVQLRAQGSLLDVKPTFVSNEYWGWWAMTPEITLGGGYSGSLGNIGYGYDGGCTCYITDSADVAFNPGDAHQLRLSYASGPFSMAVALEDASASLTGPTKAGQYGVTQKFGGAQDALGVAGQIKYSGDLFNGEIAGVWHQGNKVSSATQALARTIYIGKPGYTSGGEATITSTNGYSFNVDDSYQVGAGLGFSLGDMATLSLAGAMGHINNGQDFWGFSALIHANLADTFSAELAYGYKNYDSGTNDFWIPKADAQGILGGIYYDPVSQLTIGLEGEYQKYGDNNAGLGRGYESASGPIIDTISSVDRSDVFTVDLVTVFRF